jgi:hypothetical protein
MASEFRIYSDKIKKDLSLKKDEFRLLKKNYNETLNEKLKLVDELHSVHQENIKLITKEKNFVLELYSVKKKGLLTMDELNFVNEKLKISNNKINELLFEIKNNKNMLEIQIEDLNFLKSNMFKITSDTVNFLNTQNNNKFLGIICDDFKSNKFTIYSLLPNNQLENFNCKKVTFIDVVYHKDWNITCYFFKGLSNQFTELVSDLLFTNLIDSIDDFSIVNSVSFLEYLKNKEVNYSKEQNNNFLENIDLYKK